MKLRICFHHPLPRLLKVEAIVLYPFILFSRPREQISISILHHEMIHIRQIRTQGPLKFYFSYLLEYAQNLVRYRNHSKAYFFISFEKEAYENQERFVFTEKEKTEIQDVLTA